MIASMRITVRIVPVALLGLALLAGSASAECAWVLWSTVYDKNEDGKLQTGKTHVASAHTTKEECDRALREGAAIVRQMHTLAKKAIGETLGEITLQCLPDSIDPRGPKGK
jgi:hypothetical protein